MQTNGRQFGEERQLKAKVIEMRRPKRVNVVNCQSEVIKVFVDFKHEQIAYQNSTIIV